MDWSFDGFEALSIQDYRPYQKAIANKAAAMGNGWLAIEAFGTYGGIQIVSHFLFDSSSGIELQDLARQYVYKMAQEIDSRRPEPLIDNIFTDADPEPANIIEPGGVINSNEIESMENRKYNEDSDRAYGDPAEKAVLEYLIKQLGETNVVHWPFGKYDVDIKCRLNINSKWYFIDVENRAKHWVDLEWPTRFDSIHVPWRKDKMIRYRLPFYYYVVSRDLTRALVLAGPDILNSEIKQIKGDHELSKYEPYFNVSREKIQKYINL